MNFEYLNEMVEYIEQNLTEEIDYKKLAKIVGVSEYSLQRIFMFLTNMSLSEYIRKRRLSRAFEELKATDIKIIDLAYKYQYDSSISFSRAFKNVFGITPSECRESNIQYKIFPILKFKENNEKCDELKYQIKELDEIEIYCKKTSAKLYDDYLFNIRKLYKEILENGLWQEFDREKQYGVSFCEGEEYIYLVGSTTQIEGLEKFVIPKGKYIIFEVGSDKQEDIVKMDNNIYSQWLPSTNYVIDKDINLEIYVKDNCYICISIKDKQN